MITNLIQAKLDTVDRAYEPQSLWEELEEALARIRADWERDLRPLLPQFVTYEDVRRRVELLKH